MQSNLQQQSMEMARSAMPGWVPVASSEKKLSGGAVSILVALRKPEHAHLPFPGDEKNIIPNQALCYIWANKDNYTVKPLEQLRDFSHNLQHPTIEDILTAIRDGMASVN